MVSFTTPTFVAKDPLRATVAWFAKPLPVMVICVPPPAGPESGAIDTTLGVVRRQIVPTPCAPPPAVVP